MPDLEQNIVLKTTAEGTGSQQTAEGLKQVTTAAKDTAPAQAKLATETGKAEISHGKLATAVHKLTHAFPLLGAAADFLRHPLVGVAAVLGSIVFAIQKKVDALREAEGAMRRLANEAYKVNNPIVTLATSAVAAADNAAKFAAALGEIETKAGGAAGKLKEITDEMGRQQRLADEREDAAMAIELAQIGKREAEGGLSPEDAATARAQTRLTFGQRKAAREEGMIKQRMEVEQAAASGAFWRKSQAERALPGAAAAVAAAEKADAEAAKTFESRQKVRAKQEEDARKEIDEAHEKISTPGFFGSASESEIADARKRIAGGQDALRQLAIGRDEDAARRAQAAAILDAARRRQAGLQGEITAGTQAAAEHSGQAKTLGADLESTRAINAVQFGGQAAVNQIDEQARAAKARAEAMEKAAREMEKEDARATRALEQILGIQTRRADRLEGIVQTMHGR